MFTGVTTNTQNQCSRVTNNYLLFFLYSHKLDNSGRFVNKGRITIETSCENESKINWVDAHVCVLF